MHAESEIDSVLSEYRRILEKALKEAYSQVYVLERVSLESTLAGGKKLRPILALLSCETISGSYGKAIPIAIAYELAHSASLVQDDIIDDSDLRHEKVALHKRFGVTKSIIVSDLMIFEMFTQLGTYGDSDLPKERLGDLLRLVSRSARLTAQGEFLEIGLTSKDRISESEYLEVAKLKTGSLLAATSASGGIVAGAPEEVVDSLYRFGLNLGIAFQMRDDVLDIVGEAQKLGKPVMKDVQNNACNIVLVHAKSNANAEQKNVIDSMVYSKWFTSGDVKKLLKVLKDLGSIEYATKLISKYADASRKCLEVLPNNLARDKLSKLTHALEERKV
ncbi:MAG: polyprenyl synthetase family protein [Nitrososphaerota archaeon]|nr:polyprenyl synthetase family protein [Nitrososphaerota archaeon]